MICMNCREEFKKKEGVVFGHNFLCDSCYDYYGVIKDYHYNDTEGVFPLHGKEQKYLPFTFGWEWEIENTAREYDPDSLCHEIRRKYQHLNLYFQMDGSLSNGVEIITQPMDLNYLLEHKKEFEEIADYLIARGFTSHDNMRCGLHIHVDRDFIKNDNEKINKLFILLEFYKKEFEEFARRRSGHYNQWLSDGFYHLDQKSKDKLFSSTKAINEIKNEDHTQVLNLQHDNTLEFRLFRGTLNVDTIIASVELIYNMCYAVNELSFNTITFDKLVNLHNFKELKSYVKSKGILNGTKVRDLTKDIDRELKAKEKALESDMTTIKKELNLIIKNIDFNMNNLKNVLKNGAKIKNIYNLIYQNKFLFEDNDFKNQSYVSKITTDRGDLLKSYNNLLEKIKDNIYSFGSDNDIKFFEQNIKGNGGDI